MTSGNTIEVGNIYKIAADQENDITPPEGREVWHKHFAVMGKAADGSIYGCVVFDSAINREYVEPRDEEFFLPIAKGRYTFIDHDSYLECLKLKPATAEKLSRRHNFITLKMFGII